MNTCETPTRLSQSPGLPRSADGDPVFAEPWQAQAFAITVHLHQKGLFTWGEWADALSGQLHRPGRAEDGRDYFDGWVEALTGLMIEKGLADEATVLSLQRSWQRAAEATPHGSPIVLENDPGADKSAV